MNKEKFPAEWTELLNAYLDRQLDDGQVAQVEKILAENPQANALLADLRQVSELVHSLPNVPAPAHFSQTIQSELERDGLLGHTDLHANPAGRSHLRLRRLIAAAAMLILLGAVGTIIYSVLFAPSPHHSPESEKILAKSEPAPVEPIIALEDAYPPAITLPEGKMTANLPDDPALAVSEPVMEVPHLNSVHLTLAGSQPGQPGQSLHNLLTQANINQVVRIPLDENREQIAFICQTGQLLQLVHDLKGSGCGPIGLLVQNPGLPETTILSDITETDLRRFTALTTPAQRQIFAAQVRQPSDVQDDWQDPHKWLAAILGSEQPDLEGLQLLGNPQLDHGREPNNPTSPTSPAPAIIPGIPLAPFPPESKPASDVAEEPARQADEPVLGYESTGENANQQLLAVIIDYPCAAIIPEPNESDKNQSLQPEVLP